MRRFALYLMLLVLAFPALEIYTMFLVAESIGWWLLLWLFVSAFTGWLLIKGESASLFGRVGFVMQNGQSPFAAFWDSGRTILAGVLLMFPGVISDGMALILLLLPNMSGKARAMPGANQARTAANDDIVEGEVRVVEVDVVQIESERKPR